ncbi:hypothetical protein Tco_0812369 [Tanacetum coccineum]
MDVSSHVLCLFWSLRPCSNHPPKKLREDHGTFGSVSANTRGKSVAAIQSLLDHSTLNVEVGVTTVANVPFVTSLVTPMPELEGGGNTESISGPNLRTQYPSERFVISLDSSHHSSINVADAEVASLVRSSVLPLLLITMVVATTAISGVSSAPVLGADGRPICQIVFADSASTGAAGPDIAGPSNPASTELSTDTFYLSQDMDSGTLRQIYVPKWIVVNESILDDHDVCRSVVDQLTPPGLFSQLRGMDYDQLFVEFNVGAVGQTCLGAEVRMRSEHNLRERKRFERKCVRQADLLKEKDAEITDLKTQLSLKEANTTEAIHLCSQVFVVEAAKATRVSELNSLMERNMALDKEKNILEGIKAASLKSKRDGLVGQVSSLEATCSRLQDQVLGYELFKEQSLHLDEEFYPRFLITIASRRWIISYGLRLAVMKSRQSSEYATTFGVVIGLAINKGIHTGLVAGIEHGKARRGLSDVVFMTLPWKRGMDLLLRLRRLAGLQPSYEHLLLPIHRKEDNIVVRETPLSDSLNVVHDRCQKLKECALSCRSSISNAVGVLVEPLSSENFIGEASTSGVPATVAATTALSISVTIFDVSSIQPISVADYDVLDAKTQPETPHSQRLSLKGNTWRLHRIILRLAVPVIAAVLSFCVI